MNTVPEWGTDGRILVVQQSLSRSHRSTPHVFMGKAFSGEKFTSWLFIFDQSIDHIRERRRLLIPLNVTASLTRAVEGEDS